MGTKKLICIDFDGTLVNSPLPEEGKKIWERYHKKEYPHIGWWSKGESLDINVFDIKPYPTIYNVVKKGYADPQTHVVLLTARMKKMEPFILNVLKKYGISFDEINTKYDNREKTDKVLGYIKKFPELVEISVYDDRYEKEIVPLLNINNKVPENITYQVFLVNEGNVRLMTGDNNINENKIRKIIKSEINNYICK